MSPKEQQKRLASIINDAGVLVKVMPSCNDKGQREGRMLEGKEGKKDA